ncbi:MAG: NB-ARC domain-containing protein [Nocardioides sp.]
MRASIPPPGELIGRDVELATVVASRARVVLISGPPGVGKTELALSAAARLQDTFERQVFVSLHGFDPHLPPADWQAVRAGVLRVLSPEASHSAHDAHSEADLLAAELKAHRTLVVLDDARDPAHVGPLLRSLCESHVVVTSRHRWVHPQVDELVLAPLDVEDAVRLLAGERHGASEPGARLELGRIATLCDRLPLQLSVAAAAIRDNPGWSLRDHRVRLESLPQHERVQRSVSVSFDGLEPALGRALRLVALHPGGELTLGAAVALLGDPEPAVAGFLSRLADCCLVTCTPVGTCRLHDVVRERPCAAVATWTRPR